MSPAGSAASPFVDAESFEAASDDAPRVPAMHSPFLDAFTMEDSGSGDGALEGARRVLLAELYDEELDAALYELAGEAAGVIGTGGGGRLGHAAVELHFAPQ